MRRPPLRFTLRTIMVAVAAVGIALWAARSSHRDVLYSYELIVVGLIGSTPILICYLWLRDSPKTKAKPSFAIETLIARFVVVLVVGLVLWAAMVLLAGPSP